MEIDINDLRHIQTRIENSSITREKEKDRIDPTELLYPDLKLPSLMEDYLEIVERCTDGPRIFIQASFLSIIGALAGTEFILPNGKFLNTYILLIGASGITRKTTIQNFALDLFRDVVGWLGVTSGDVVINPGGRKKEYKTVNAYEVITNGSVEGIRSTLDGEGKTVVSAMGEYKTIFDLSKRNGAQNTITSLTEMFDTRPINEVLRSSRVAVSNRYSFSILGCSTNSWLNDFFTKSNAAGGFINRHLCYLGSAADEPLTMRSDPNPEKWKTLVSNLSEIFPQKEFSTSAKGHEFAGKTTFLKLDKAAESFLAEVNKDHFKLMKTTKDDHSRDLMAREMDHLLKLGGIHAVLEGRSTIETDDLLFGHLIAEKSTELLLSIASNQPTPMKKRVIKYIEDKGSVKKREIAQYFGGKQDTLNKILDDLRQEEMLAFEDGEWSVQK